MNILTGEVRVTVSQSPSEACRHSNDGEETELPHETSKIRGGGSEMEPLSSLQEIICLIKDFPPSCSLDQSEVFAPERG